MPELPEVETVKNSLKEIVINKVISNVLIYYEKIIKSELDFKNLLINQKINDIKRIGKYLIFILDNYYLIVHLRMEGKFIFKKDQEKEKHEHIIFVFDDFTTLRFNDTRKFGCMYLYPINEYKDLNSIPVLSKLGIEPFNLEKKYLEEKLLRRNLPIKSLLLDQSIISGLGNIYADEVLFYSNIHPLKKGNELTCDDILNIIKNSIIVLNKAIKLGGTTIKSFSHNDISGRFQNELCVHTKKKCLKCNEDIIKIYVGQRGTYFCPKCQSKE